MKKIKVLIVDDSALIRKILSEIINQHPKLEVIGTASDPYAAVQKIKQNTPDVITLDVEMPKMDGITFLQRIMSQHPMPVVIISSLTQRGSEIALRALDAGAIEIITKPELQLKEFFDDYKVKLHDKIIAASVALVRKPGLKVKHTAEKVVGIRSTKDKPVLKTTEKVIVVGASTGGTEALKSFLEVLPPDCPGIVIVQHMPEMFTRQFAERLNSICKIRVTEGKNGDTVLRGQAIIAQGNRHTLLKRSGARYYIEVKDGPLVNRHRPSVDVLFKSTAKYAGQNTVAVIMTGMGNDGAEGMKELKQAGAITIAQDESSCVVFGMPKEAIKLNCIDKILPLKNIAANVLSLGK